jgi:hypothetical protein
VLIRFDGLMIAATALAQGTTLSRATGVISRG